MKPELYIQGFASIAIVGLGCSVLPCFWVHMLIGGVLVVMLVRNGELIRASIANNPTATTRQMQFGHMGGRRFAAAA